MIRHVFLIGALLFAMTPANDATAQVVAVALDLDFNNPADVNSGGNFTVVASTFGGGTQISNLKSALVFDAPPSSQQISAIFQSTVCAVPAAVPEPNCLSLLARGLVGFVATRTRSVRKASSLSM